MDFKQPPRRNLKLSNTTASPQNVNSVKQSSVNPARTIPAPQRQQFKPPETFEEDFRAQQTDQTSLASTSNPTSPIELHIGKKRRSIKKIILFVVISIIALLAIAGGVYWFILKPDQANSSPTDDTVALAKHEEQKQVITSPLTGVEVTDINLTKRPVTGIMIENSPDARPQSGLLDAGIVYEAIAEGGITRFLALFQESQPSYIGPVRSARPYYVDFASSFNASYAHVGGSPEALQDIKTLKVRDLDQFYNANAYDRVTNRYAPHNVYTGFDKLDKLNQSKGYTSSPFTAFVRKPDVPQTPTARIIDFSISSPLYSPRYEYDASTNTYKRFQNGEPHIDEKTKKQLSPDVVLALITEKGYDPDGYHTDYKTTGSGKMYVFQDGIVSEGTWQKASRTAPYTFTDKNGLPMKLNTGQTWISLIANQSDVTYKP